MTEQVTIRETEKGKFALQHSTVTALIVGGFIIGSEVLESLIPASGTVLSLFVAIAILVMLRPMQRLALRMADRLLHSVQSTPAYPEIPRLEVYRRRFGGSSPRRNRNGQGKKNLESLTRRFRDFSAKRACPGK